MSTGRAASDPGVKIVFDEYAFERMYALAKAALPNEVGGLGLVKRLPSGELYVYETFVLPQVCGPGSTTLDPDGVAKWMVSNKERLPDCRVWWHSHANFNVFLSGTDEECIRQLLTVMPWVITPVVNVRNDLHLTVSIKEPTMYRLECEYDVESPAAKAAREAEAIVKANVKEIPRAILPADKAVQSESAWNAAKGSDHWSGRDWILDNLGSEQARIAEFDSL